MHRRLTDAGYPEAALHFKRAVLIQLDKAEDFWLEASKKNKID